MEQGLRQRIGLISIDAEATRAALGSAEHFDARYRSPLECPRLVLACDA